ncbi:MAG: UvrB/UvrC motif-containing protein, partial [Desulfatiglandales bacterium]|nr:UvrB/UvrC motif-containing protein [Desulfatiglandales bacterium]
MILQIKRFLKGHNREIRAYLTKQMDMASEGQNYEDAARHRDQLSAIIEFARKQKKASQDFKDRDVIVVSSENSYGIGVVLRIRNGHIMGREKFNLKVHDPDAGDKTLSQFILQYYSSTIDIPEEVLIEQVFDELTEYENWLKGIRQKRVQILVPERGEKRKLVEISKRNSDLLLGELRLKQAKRKELLTKPVLQLQEDLGMEVAPRRIEAFDNSNIQGSNPVAGMVCFIDGKSRKSEYRKFHIKTVEGIDDFASMH